MNESTHSGTDGVWVPCGTCWGQRKVYRATGDGVLAAHTCHSCMGLGERLTGGDQVHAQAA